MYTTHKTEYTKSPYIKFNSTVPRRYIFGSGSGYKAGEPCTIKAQLIEGNVWVTIISGKVGYGYEPQLLKRIPADGVKADDYESIYKLAQKAL